jgi:hypothetical protein
VINYTIIFTGKLSLWYIYAEGSCNKLIPFPEKATWDGVLTEVTIKDTVPSNVTPRSTVEID